MMSTDYLLPGYWNSDICVATSAMNRPRLFTHWIPRLQTLNERSLSQLRQQPTNSRLKFIDDYLEGARRGEDKAYAFMPPGMPESNTTHKRDETALSLTTCVAHDPGSPSRHVPRPVTATLIPTLSQSSDLDSPTTSLSSASDCFSEAMMEDSCPPEHCRDIKHMGDFACQP